MQSADARAALNSARTAARPAMPEVDVAIVLEPLTRPELGPIRVDPGTPLAVGRSEAPFAACGDDVLAMLSRRHARLFCEGGSAFVADLNSSNGTTVNRARIGPAPHALRDGDEIAFGGVLSYRVRIASPAAAVRAPSLRLVLAPAGEGSALAPIVVTRLPLLVGKHDPAFAACREQNPAALAYLSRRHAHVFAKDGGVWIEDLASTNGTFVDGLRLAEHAVPLEDGMLLAFGSEHFTYRVNLDAPARAGVPVTQPAPQPAAPSRAPVSDKTTFVAAPTSFLEIFHADDAPGPDTMSPEAAALPEVAAAAPRRPRSRIVTLWSELAALAIGDDEDGDDDDEPRPRRRRWIALAVVAAAMAAAVALYLHGSDERELRQAVAQGRYEQAATLAYRALGERADDVELRAMATETALKAHVPAWQARLDARDAEGTNSALAALAALADRNPDLKPLVGELEWLGELVRVTGGRAGAPAPIRLYGDEDRIAALLARWNENTGEHQRSLARIAAHVTPFETALADALTRLRRLQSEATVQLPAIERLKATIAAGLDRDNPQSIESALDEFAARHPDVGGVEAVRDDLARFLEVRRQARAAAPGRLFAALAQARFATPPFQGAFRALSAQQALPPAALVEQYDAATRRWIAGDAAASLAALRAIGAGPWAGAIAVEARRRQALLAQFEALPAAADNAAALLAFRATLDPVEDAYFVRATDAGVERHRQAALARAQSAMTQARALWQQYLDSGAIDARQRSETVVGAEFRNRARLLAEAARQSELATQTFTQVGAAAPAAWAAIRDDIGREAQLQRSALLELRNVLEPALLRDKLALLGTTGTTPR